MANGHPEELPQDYYLANFHALASFVLQTYQDLLSEAETAWYASICEAPVEAQRLYIRLLTRKGSVFRLGKLHYPEAGCLNEASDALSSRALASREPPSLELLVSLFTKPELIRHLQLNAFKSLPRPELVETICNAEVSVQQQYAATLQAADEWISVSGHAHWTVFKLCFFGNLYQDSTEFVLRDIGAVQYESYEIDATSRVFQSRVQLEAHLSYFECEALYQTIDAREVDQLNWLLAHMPEPVDNDPHLLRRVNRFQNRIARQFERLNETDLAMALYERTTQPPARERRARLYLAAADLRAAQSIVNAMQDSPFSEAETQVAVRLQRQINKASGVALESTPRFRPTTTHLSLAFSGGRVEHEAASWFAQSGRCFYTENQLVNGVLGLFIWDIIFHPVPGVFFNPFQSAPTDFREPAFTRVRRELLAQRLSELRQPLSFKGRVMANWSQHQGKSNPLVRWRYLSVDILTMALDRIPADHWRLLFERVLSDLRENTAGLPDLVLFPEAGGYELLEIKGPGDVVQLNQRRWMRYFEEHAIPYRVVNVQWAKQVETDDGSE